MMEPRDALEKKVVDLARPALEQEIRERGFGFDAAKVRVLRRLSSDVDGDGREETVFVAGIPEFGAPATLLLHDPFRSIGDEWVTLLPFETGFRELFVSDVNGDGTPEVVALWQADFGLYLSVNVLQWDGNVIRDLFPPTRFHQGFMERKDLDADGIDEILIWSGIYETDPRWGPQFFNTHVFRYNGQAYELQRIHRSVRRYLPAPLLGQRISFTGLPEQFELPPSPADQHRRIEEHLVEHGGLTPEFLGEIGSQYVLFAREGFHDEALQIVELVLEAVEHIDDPEARVELSHEA